MIKASLGAMAALLLAGAMYVQPAHAQPQGSYLETCTHVGMHGDRLTADCRRMDGSWQRTVLDVHRCPGTISNMNVRLTCDAGATEGYGSSRGEDWRDEHRQRCAAMVDPRDRELCRQSLGR